MFSDRDARELFCNVHANILSIPFPFIGVDGTSVCSSIFDTDGKTKVSCPLKKDHVYRYINTFKILDRYPKVSTNGEGRERNHLNHTQLVGVVGTKGGITTYRAIGYRYSRSDLTSPKIKTDAKNFL